MKLLTPLLALGFAAFSVPALHAQNAGAPAAPVTPRPKLGSAVFIWEKMVMRSTNNGARRDVAENPTATLEEFECHITTLNPGIASHPPHRHAREEFIIVKEGNVEASINGALQRAGPGSILFYAANDLHNIRNVGATPATYLVFNLMTAATHSAPTEGATVAAVPGKMVSRVFDWQKLEVAPTKTGERRAIASSPTTTLTNLSFHATTLKAGESPHAAHRHPDEEIVIVKDGLIEVTINGVSQRAGPGSIFFYGSNDEHGMKNVGTTTATYHVVRFVTASTPQAPAPPEKKAN